MQRDVFRESSNHCSDKGAGRYLREAGEPEDLPHTFHSLLRVKAESMLHLFNL